MKGIKTTILTLVFFNCILYSCTPDKTPPFPPNIVIVLTDDQGYQDLGCFGAPNILTPNIDKLASNGVKLTNYYAPQAVCSASRAGILTGCYPNRIGMHQAFMPNSQKGINKTETTLAEMLKLLGYSTGIFGKWHLGDSHEFLPLQHGFDEYFGIPYSNDMWPYHPQQGPVFNFGPLPLYDNNTIIDTLEDQSMLTTQITDRSCDFIRKHKDNPFFLYVPHPQPHVPLFVSDKFKGKSKRGLYGDVIMEIDWSVGQIMQTLEESNLLENTLVIFTSDNGPWLAYGDHAGSALPLREGKGTTFEGGQREPFVIHFPPQLDPLEIDIPTMGIDLLPTIAHLTGAKLPVNKIDGKNIWEILRGNSTISPHDAYYFYYNVNELQAIQSGEWKMYFPHTYRTMEGQTPGTGGLPGSYKMMTLANPELYHIKSDISEHNNVYDQFPKVVARLDSLAHIKRKEIGDKLLNIEGKENRPPGFVSKMH